MKDRVPSVSFAAPGAVPQKELGRQSRRKSEKERESPVKNFVAFCTLLLVCLWGATLTAQLDPVCDTPGDKEGVIPDGDSSGLTRTITIDEADSVVIDDLDVSVEITHAWLEDLTLSLTSPSGTTVSLFDQSEFDEEAGMLLVFDDDSATSHGGDTWDCDCNMQAAGSLSDVDGEDSGGDWSFLAIDNASLDEGTLDEWCLIITEFVPPSSFLRGDIDGDGEVVALIDAIFGLDWGFNDGDDPPCEDAADVDGDNSVDVLSDVISLLNWQYMGGDAPADPGVEDCGLDPVDEADEVGCENSTCEIAKEEG